MTEKDKQAGGLEQEVKDFLTGLVEGHLAEVHAKVDAHLSEAAAKLDEVLAAAGAKAHLPAQLTGDVLGRVHAIEQALGINERPGSLKALRQSAGTPGRAPSAGEQALTDEVETLSG